MELSSPQAGRHQAGRAVGLVVGVLLLSVQDWRDGADAGDLRASARSQPAQTVRFNRDVRPLLADRCFPCHGPDAEARQGGLRLDTAEGPQGAYRERGGTRAIQPGSPQNSELWYRLTTEDESEAMPPLDSHKERLDARELGVLERWIEEGAEYEPFWAFVAPVRSAPPVVGDARWGRRAIDRFVFHALEERGLQPSPRADRRTLLRRLSFDLTGLPPTLDEIRAFLDDESPGAYERVVERLLESPHYGEHMARYWLDLVRFADTNGLHHDHFRDMSRYRDWVIRSFSENRPYSEFVIDQVAGDLHAEPTVEQLTASGFNRLHMIIDRGTMLPEESFARNVIDRVSAVGTAFLGLTLQCAVCHDHKYDPIEQKDFFQLYAFFNNFDGAPETGGRSGADFRRGLQPPYISFPTPQQTANLERLDADLEQVRARVTELQAACAAAEGEARLAALQASLKESQDEERRLRRERTEVLVTVDAAMVMRERSEVRPTHILVRGAYDQPGELVERDTPGFLPPLGGGDGVKSRLDLARWLVAPEHPLTARVAVNRFWQQLFGVGLVKTAEDFGAQGEWPTHMELLDHLAVEFVESGWDVKALMKQLVLSEVYQQSSAATPAAFEADPENRMLARGSRFRMDSEMIRDQILASSGLLQPTLYGPSVKPPQPAGIWKAVSLPDSFPRTFEADEGDKIYRRSVYTFWKRGMPPPQMTLLNAPTRESCTARRERTNTPMQALLLLNEEEYLKAARHLAAATLSEVPLSPERRLEVIYESITSRALSAAVQEALLQSVRDLEALYAQRPKLAEQLCEGAALPEGGTAPELAAWTLLVSSVYNLDVTKTRE